MIIGIGTDLIETERVKVACSKRAFLTHCFTLKEIELIQSDHNKSAGNFAVKEAVSKALGTGFRGVSLKDIEVLRNELGKPYVTLYGKALDLCRSLGIKQIHVSISNTREFTTAFAVAEGVRHI